MFIRKYNFFLQINLDVAAGGTVQISLTRECWAVYVSLTGTNGQDGEDRKQPGICGEAVNLREGGRALFLSW